MAVLDRLRTTTNPTTEAAGGGKTPPDVRERMRRGEDAMRKNASTRRVCFRFYRGDHYSWVNERNQISTADTITHTTGGGKPPHRVRTSRNFFRQILEAKVSAATNAQPGYEVSATTVDPEAASAAKIAEKVAVYGYDQWDLERHRQKLVTNAVVADGGYIMAYFDPDVGPYVKQPDGTYVGWGEVKILVLNGNQVAWEPGTDFEDSPWWVIVRARPTGEVENMKGYTGGKLKADANTAEVPTDRTDENMVLVREYLERPTAKNPNGRKLTIADGRVILPPESYPLVNPDGQVCDEPVLQELSYTADTDSDRNMGLGDVLLEPQRTLNDCVSRIIEWKNRCLNPRMLAPRGSLKRPPDDAPGKIDWYDPVGGMKPEWEKPPPIPGELFTLMSETLQEMQALAADPGILNATSAQPGTLQVIAQQAQQRWTTFLSSLAKVDARLMRQCLWLVARYYTEPRVIEFRGHFGWEDISDFRGAMLGGQCNVRVSKTTLVAQSREQIQQEIQFFAATFPNSVAPEAAMSAYHAGSIGNLIGSYDLDVQKANRIIKALRAGPAAVFGQPMQHRIDPAGNPYEVPWWMPEVSDNIRVWKQMLGDYMKTVEFEQLDPGVQQAGREIYDGLMMQEMRESVRQAQMQNQIAAEQGMQNAAAPQVKGMPSQPSPLALQPGPSGNSGNTQQ